MSLKKIAEAAGTSISTVSRVLSGSAPNCASPQLRDKIWKAAQELHYTPNLYARNLKKGAPAQSRPRSVSIVLARIFSLEDDPFFGELFRSLESELLASDCVLERVVEAKETLPADFTHTDGIFILGRCSERLLKNLRGVSENLVGIWRNHSNFDVDEVLCDGQKAACTAMEHLYALGHRRIGYIGDCSHESRYLGYCDFMMKHALPLDYQYILPTNQTRAQGQSAFERLIALPELPSALLCANDITALGVLDGLSAMGKRARPELSVISIDNIALSQECRPMLTTINIPKEDMAHMAVQLLLDRMARRHREFVRIELPCRLIRRESCRKISPSS